MQIIKYIFSFVTGLLMLVSCDSNQEPFLVIEDASVYFDSDPNRFVASVSENNATLKVPLILAGIPGTYPVTVTVEVDTANSENPALEGIDFTIKKKEITFEEGYGTKYVEVRTIDNLEKNAARHFDLVITSMSRPLKHNISDRLTVSVFDDEHPLRHLFGRYKASGTDLLHDGIVEQFYLTMSADPDDDSMVQLQGFLPEINRTIKMRIDLENNVCSIPANQEFKVDGYGKTILCNSHREEDNTVGWDYNDIIGEIQNGGTEYIFLDLVGAVIVDENDDYYKFGFFVYKNFTIEKQ